MICYLDNAATTKVLPSAMEAACNIMEINFCNPSAVHEGGAQASAALKKAREAVATALGVVPQSVIFTASGTEATNTALFGAAFKNKRFGKHIISTMIEHDATLNTLKELTQQGYEVTLIRPKKDGSIALEDVETAMREDTILLSIMAVNNETGAVLPYAESAAALKKKCPNALVHFDCVQAFGKMKIDTKNCDLLSLSAHKIGGLKGVGALYIRQGLTIRPHVYGGGQEGGMRSGTENLPGIVAFGAAVEARFAKMDSSYAHLEGLKAQLLAGLGGEWRINSPQNSAPYIINISAMHSRSEIFIRLLSERGIYVAGGSACSRGKKSHVLAAMDIPKSAIDSALRISFCPETSAEDVGCLLAALPEIARQLQRG